MKGGIIGCLRCSIYHLIPNLKNLNGKNELNLQKYLTLILIIYSAEVFVFDSKDTLN